VKNEKPIEPVFSLKFQLKYSFVMVFGSVIASLTLFFYLDQGLGNGYFESLVTLSNLEATVPSYLVMSFGIQLILICLITIVIHLFVSHKIAGPVYRYELALTSILKDDLRYDVRTRQGDQLKSMVSALNGFIHSMRGVYAEVHALHDLLDTELQTDSPDLDRVAEKARQLRLQLNGQGPNYGEAKS